MAHIFDYFHLSKYARLKLAMHTVEEKNNSRSRTICVGKYLKSTVNTIIYRLNTEDISLSPVLRAMYNLGIFTEGPRCRDQINELYYEDPLPEGGETYVTVT